MKQTFTYFLIAILCLFGINSYSQTAVTAVHSTYVTSAVGKTYIAGGAVGSPTYASSNQYTYKFGANSGTTNNDLRVDSFNAGASYVFYPVPNQYVKIRRADNPVVQGTRELVYYLGAASGSTNGSTITAYGTYLDSMEQIFNGNLHFNCGTDNIFGNQGDGNGDNNDIERLDVIYPTGFAATDYSKIGFAVFERGAQGAHDPVKVAVILALDGSGNPSKYSDTIGITMSTYGAADPIGNQSYLITRNDLDTVPNLQIATTTNQGIGGVFFQYSKFHIPNYTKIYGYSLIPADFSGDSTKLVDYTDTTYFPRNTTAATDAAGGIDPVAFNGVSQSANVIYFPVSGNVYDDANGLSDGIVNGTGTNAGGKLYVHLVNSGNTVVSTVAVNSDGTYTFPITPTPGTYSIVLDTSSGASLVANLPAGWANTGEKLGTSSGNDGTVNGILTNVVVVAYTSVTNANFGIEQPPTANTVTATSQVNPGGTVQVTVPTLNGSDPEQGTFPGTGNADTIIINTIPANGILYYNGVAVNAGDTIKNYNPTKLTLDPNDGAISASFTYSEVDAALKSSTPATVTMPFTTIGISGTVLDDANGLTDNTVNGTGTNAGGLNAVLVNTTTGLVLSSTAVAAGGTYSFVGLNAGNYSVEITTNTATVGSTPPAVALPSGWVSTGENLGAGAGSDGTIDGKLTIGVISSNVTNANFGIEQPPTANTVTATAQVNPGGTNQVQVSALGGTDPEDGIIGSNGTITISTLPTNGILYYNAIPVTVGQTITNYDPTQLMVDPNDGSVTISFTYTVTDAAGVQSPTATVTMPFTSILPISLTAFSAEVISNNKVEVKWSTSSEINTSYFEVERSNNGTEFTSVSKVAAQGNADVLTNYQALDQLPLQGVNYYRLKIVDVNGTVTYSQEVPVKVDGISSLIVSVMPNPFADFVLVNLNLRSVSKIKISITDISGRIMYSKNTNGISGINRINVDGLSNLARGSYIINIFTEEGNSHQTIIKQ